ncbi:unnamed protein product [Chondrus crispus]|uniref:Uncharacterized protein n=1 Tax=Chondrus crispus TaxID=2769 RepID=R7QKD9_CHOCR|nr:unnamed protein product [Chondrus crispus]CDF37946.1 unnamed protein product [Chondrus crispus]|eukprot:XP_005717815.1 unnamed protein product [Chondrus crispus]
MREWSLARSEFYSSLSSTLAKSAAKGHIGGNVPIGNTAGTRIRNTVWAQQFQKSKCLYLQG